MKKKVAIKNYTSEVNPAVSISKIEHLLSSAGATDISKSYANGECVSIKFRIVIETTPRFFELPAKVEAIYNIFMNDRIKKNDPVVKRACAEQARRTAWKIISDWVEIQITMIKMEQAEVAQVFLPYAYDPQSDTTLYDRIKKGGYKLLSNSNSQ
jgi:hypothetical protein